MRRMRLAALCAFGSTAPGSGLQMRDCYGADTKEWLTGRRPAQVQVEGCSFEESEWSANDLRHASSAAARAPLYRRLLARERTCPDPRTRRTAGEVERGALVRAQNRELLAASLNRHHAWLHRRRYTRFLLLLCPALRLHDARRKRGSRQPAAGSLGLPRPRLAAPGPCPLSCELCARQNPPLAGTILCTRDSVGMGPRRIWRKRLGVSGTTAKRFRATATWRLSCAASPPAICRAVPTCGSRRSTPRY